MTVIRTNTSHICANGKWFNLKDLVDTAFEQVKAWGCDNPGFNMPSWFYTGSLYADEIVALGCKEVEPPKTYCIEFVPRLGKVWRRREPIWPEIFNCKAKEKF